MKVDIAYIPKAGRGMLWALLGAMLLVPAAGCGGGKTDSRAPQGGQAGLPAEAGQLDLELSAVAEGSDYRLILSAPSAQDLYQLAGELRFDQRRYRVERVEAASDLGSPLDSYLLAEPAGGGAHGFAFTRRWAGPGASGRIELLHFIITPLEGRLELADFQLNPDDAPLRVRDSRKHDFAVRLRLGRVQR